MAIVTKIEFKLMIPLVAEASGDQPTKWSNSLNVNADIINNRRNAKIGDAATFNDKVAVPSSLGFAPIVDSAFVSRKGRDQAQIREAQAQKLGGSFKKWSGNLDYAFAEVDGEPAKRFKDANLSKAGNWADGVAQTTLRFTGDKIRGRSVSAIAAYLLTGDARVLGFLREGDEIITGAPYDVSLDGQANSYRAALTQMITRAGLAIYRSGYLEARFTAMNAALTQAANAFRDPAKANEFISEAPGEEDSFLWFITEEGLFKLHGKVNLGA
jgi:hypothetical protein